MNSPLTDHTRTYLKELIAMCAEPQQLLFKRMYSHKNLSLPLDEVVDNMPEEKLLCAVGQCERTLTKAA